MKLPPHTQPFERKLAIWRNRMPSALVDACVFVNDTIEMSHAIGKQQFGENVDPSVVMDIYESIVTAMIRYSDIRDDIGLDEEYEEL